MNKLVKNKSVAQVTLLLKTGEPAAEPHRGGLHEREWPRRPRQAHPARAGAERGVPGREPLRARLLPRSQIRRGERICQDPELGTVRVHRCVGMQTLHTIRVYKIMDKPEFRFAKFTSVTSERHSYFQALGAPRGRSTSTS